MSTALMALPCCPEHRVEMILVSPATQTREQRWAGVWYRCPCCTSSTLFPSQALLAQHREMGGSDLTRHFDSRGSSGASHPFRTTSSLRRLGSARQ
jgi:hypothetical protein